APSRAIEFAVCPSGSTDADEDAGVQVLPRTRSSRIIAGVLLVALLVAVWVRREALWFAANLVVPGPAFDAAADRTSDPAPVGRALPLPTAVEADRPTGTDPALSLGRGLALPGASALADPAGPGPVLVSTLDGKVHEVDLDARTTDVVLDVSDRISTGGERGLLGLAVDPDGDRVYLDFTGRGGDTEVRSWALDAAGRPVPGDGVLHLEIGQPYSNHNGGNLVFGPDGALWIGTGDGGGAGDRGEVAQDDGWLLGKMLRVVPDPAGGVVAPSTNPGWERPEVWGIGLRNPWRYSFDRETRRLWIADVGQNTIEEVSVVDPTAPRPNFGWDTVEGANDYEGEPHPDFTAPVVTYGHDDGCSITGGYVYRGAANAGLYGWYLYADYCTGFIRAVPADAPTDDPMLLAEDVGNVVSFGELEDGELVVLTAAGIQRILPG
ncbi:MAG: PQQ-dependent sugar dehydrogenase, partial [Acidimicrobiales bacterium]